jgi:hypothetical protein
VLFITVKKEIFFEFINSEIFIETRVYKSVYRNGTHLLIVLVKSPSTEPITDRNCSVVSLRDGDLVTNIPEILLRDGALVATCLVLLLS